MSRFFDKKYSALRPYVPGEQPREGAYIKLNTNESPFPPAPGVLKAAANARNLRLYSDPAAELLTAKIAEVYGVEPDEVIVGNGSDECLYFSFLAFGGRGAAFPDITYGFYPVFADITETPYEEIPLTEDFRIDPESYKEIGKTVYIANPNAPTGIALPTSAICDIAESNPDNVVVVDEAYVDFGADSCLPLIKKYDNLLVVRTFSKSRSLAGARLGFAFARSSLIADLNTVRFSINPYNVNSMTQAAGIASLEDEEYTKANTLAIAKTRSATAAELERLGFSVLPSKANFVFAAHGKIGGGRLYEELKKRGILVRHFDKERIKDYNRITIGSAEQMETLIRQLEDILKNI